MNEYALNHVKNNRKKTTKKRESSYYNLVYFYLKNQFDALYVKNIELGTIKNFPDFLVVDKENTAHFIEVKLRENGKIKSPNKMQLKYNKALANLGLNVYYLYIDIDNNDKITLEKLEAV